MWIFRFNEPYDQLSHTHRALSLTLTIRRVLGQNSCVDETFSTWEVSFERLRKISRIAVSGLIAGYSVEVSVSEETFQPLRLANGDHLVS